MKIKLVPLENIKVGDKIILDNGTNKAYPSTLPTRSSMKQSVDPEDGIYLVMSSAPSIRSHEGHAFKTIVLRSKEEEINSLCIKYCYSEVRVIEIDDDEMALLDLNQ
jgi:hypothetical protein